MTVKVLAHSKKPIKNANSPVVKINPLNTYARQLRNKKIKK